MTSLAGGGKNSLRDRTDRTPRSSFDAGSPEAPIAAAAGAFRGAAAHRSFLHERPEL
jgi:hypothetical protein